MMRLLLIIILMLSFQSWTKADNHQGLIELADEGDAIAQNNLGHYYLYRSENNPENLDKAIYYLNSAAAQEQVNAMTTVGWTYFTGDYGAPQDNEQAIYWNKKASDKGFTIASYNMGFFYYSGLAGLEQDLDEAKRYWFLSASQWVNSDGLHSVRADGLLEEINQYNPNPSKKMIELRDLFISLLKSQAI